MTIFCKLCRRSFNSLKPDEGAQAEVLTQMGQHLGIAHRDDAHNLAVMLAGLQNLSATYLLLRGYVEIPQTEATLRASFEENQSVLFAMFDTIKDPESSPPQPVGQRKGPNVKSGPLIVE